MVLEKTVHHPAHYGGKDDPYEAIRVIEAWGAGFNLGTALKYICRAGKKGPRAEDLHKAVWYLLRETAAAEGVVPDYYNELIEDARRRSKAMVVTSWPCGDCPPHEHQGPGCDLCKPHQHISGQITGSGPVY